MATQREIIYSVKNILRGGLITDDDRLSDRQIAFLIDGARAVLLRQQYDKGQLMSENNIQHLQCVPVTSTDTAFNDVDFPSDCRVYRSNARIPRPIEAKGKDLIMSITSAEFGGFTYEVVPYTRIPYMQYTRFKRPAAVLYNGYIYLVNAPYTEQISVSGIFENPNDLASFDSCSTRVCFDWDTPYPVSSHLIDPIIKMVTEELTLMLKVQVDKTNNANEGLEPQTKTEEGGS